MSVRPPEAARYRAAAVTASVAFHGSATPSPFASTPQRSHVSGMNCIQPIAPAELGPMFWPKLDSILLIAASTCHRTPYAVPACCHNDCSSANETTCGAGGGVVNETGTEIDPGAFGVAALGRESATRFDPAETETLKPRTLSPPSARAVPTTSANATVATTAMCRITVPRAGGSAAALRTRRPQQARRGHASQNARHDRANHRLLDAGEELDHAADRLGRVDGMHRREHEVA